MEWKILGELFGEKWTLVLITFEVVHPLAFYKGAWNISMHIDMIN